MDITIHPRYEIEQIIPTKKSAYITISDTSRAFANIPNTKLCHDVLECHFDDIVRDTGDNLVMFTEDDAKRIWAFVDGLPDDVEHLYVNCEMGQSRSAAVAAAISLIKFGKDKHIWDEQIAHGRYRYSPNMVIYSIMVREKGIEPWYADKLEFFGLQGLI